MRCTDSFRRCPLPALWRQPRRRSDRSYDSQYGICAPGVKFLSRFALVRGFIPLAILLCGGFILALPWNAAAQESVSIQGTVVNGTAGSSVADELAVLLLITAPDGTLAGTGQTLAAPDGSFVFEDVAEVSGGAYTLSVDYGGVFYGLTISEDELEAKKTITVYEPTEDAGIITVDRHVMVITSFDVSERVATRD